MAIHLRRTILASPAMAIAPAVLLAEPSHGCFARNYDAAHLATHPDQVVASMLLEFSLAGPQSGMSAPESATIAAISVILANQGHVARASFPEEGKPEGFGGEEMYNALICETWGERVSCATACGGGGFEVTRDDGGTLEISTGYLAVGWGQDCGGFADLADLAARPGVPITYNLSRVADAVCAAGLGTGN